MGSDLDRVQRRVGVGGGGGERVELGGRYDGAGLGAGDGGQPAAGSEVEYGAAVHQRRVVEDTAGQGLRAGPGEGPERRRDAFAGEPRLRRLPDRGDLGREMEADLGDERGRADGGVGGDESGGAHVESAPIRKARPIASPVSRFSLKRARQPAGSSTSSVMACQASRSAGSSRAT